MPTLEGICQTHGCELFGVRQWHYYPRFSSPLQPCDNCGGAVAPVMSAPAIVFTGVITARYNDRDKDNPHRDGHWGYDRNPETGKVTPVRIETFQQQKDYCKRNGLANPKDIGRNYEVAEDGRTVKNSMGMPGCEV